MRRGSVVIILFWCVVAGGFQHAYCFPTEPSRSWVYPYLYELRLRQKHCRLFVSTGPYERRDVARWLEARCDDSTASRRSLWLYGMLREEFGPEIVSLRVNDLTWTQDAVLGLGSESGGQLKSEAFLRFAVYSKSGLCLWTSLRSTINAPEYHKIETRPWKDRGRASFDYGGIGYRRGRFAFFVGRDELSWGAARQMGLLCSGSAPSLDMFKFAFQTKRFLFTSFHSQLRRGQSDEWGGEVRRFLAGHRLEVVVGERLSFSVSEVVVYGGEGRTFEPVYMNPLTAFYAEQWNSGWNDNVLVAADFSLLLAKRAEIRGEIMIDDFQYDFVNEPHEFGAGLTVMAISPFHGESSLIGGSYFHLRNQTYGHFISWNRFLHEGTVIGYPDGPDGDRFQIWCSVAFPDPLLWRFDYVYRRKGEGKATDPQQPKGHRVSFPSGTVETRHTVGLGLCWRPSYEWFVGGRVEWFHENNPDHIKGETTSGFNLLFTATFNLKLWPGLRD